MWTRFMDMHSGGGSKEPWENIYIEAPEAEAAVIFYNRFGHNPHRVTCTCCGEDYSLTESETLEEATAYERGCDYAYFDKDGNEVDQHTIPYWKLREQGGYGKYVERPADPKRVFVDKYRTLDEYLELDGVLVIRAEDIKPDERTGSLPEQGYVWID